LAAAIFTLLSPALKFGQLRYETFLTPLYLLAWICWFPGIQSSGRFLLAGLVLGLAALTKQNAILFIGLFLAAQAGLWLLTRRPLCDLVRATLLAGLGAVLPAVAAAALYAATKGDWAALFFWVFEFNDLELIQMLALAPTSSELVLLLAIFLPASAALVWGVLSARIRSKLIIPVILCLSGIVLSIPRFGFEHLQPGFSGVAIITAMGILDALSMLRRTWKKVLVAGLVAAWSLGIPAYLLSNPESPRYIHEYSRLPMLAAQVREQIGPNACPYLFPIDEANANLYYLLGCPPPGELWLFTAYPFYSRFDLPQQAKIALERASPQWVLYFPGRWDTETHNPGLTAYVRTHYKAKTTLIFDDSTLWLMERR
jgi:4-amino-4-deoxy-L-arabinose transferase-like glycosyltransferase